LLIWMRSRGVIWVLPRAMVRHVNRIKGLLFSQGVRGYEPLHRNRRRTARRTEDGRWSSFAKASEGPRSAVSSIGSNCCSSKSKRWRQSRTRCLPRNKLTRRRRRPCCSPSRASDLTSPLSFGRKDFSDTSTIDAKSLEERIDREQGVSKARNPRLRTTLIQLAWLWLRHQPQSALALWFKERVVRNRDRLKKAAIAALARKLLVALWKYVAAGAVIEGAIMKAA
jgi:transposase